MQAAGSNDQKARGRVLRRTSIRSGGAVRAAAPPPTPFILHLLCFRRSLTAHSCYNLAAGRPAWPRALVACHKGGHEAPQSTWLANACASRVFIKLTQRQCSDCSAAVHMKPIRNKHAGLDLSCIHCRCSGSRSVAALLLAVCGAGALPLTCRACLRRRQLGASLAVPPCLPVRHLALARALQRLERGGKRR